MRRAQQLNDEGNRAAARNLEVQNTQVATVGTSGVRGIRSSELWLGRGLGYGVPRGVLVLHTARPEPVTDHAVGERCARPQAPISHWKISRCAAREVRIPKSVITGDREFERPFVKWRIPPIRPTGRRRTR